jgi:hypothetical protein
MAGSEASKFSTNGKQTSMILYLTQKYDKEVSKKEVFTKNAGEGGRGGIQVPRWTSASAQWNP